MIRKATLTLGAAMLAASVAADVPSPFVGSWGGEWDKKKGKGQLNVLNVLAVDAEGRMTGVYCFQRPNGIVTFFHVNPGGIESSIKGNVLSFKNPWRGRNKYTLTEDDTLRLRMTTRARGGGENVSKMTMTRQPEPVGCAVWIAPPTPE